MRISNNAVFNPYLRNLQKIQERKYEEEVRLSTGERIINVSDDPKALVNIKQLTTIIDRNEIYRDNIATALGEMQLIDEQITGLQDTLQEIRQRAIEAGETGSGEGLPSLATYVEGLLKDVVRNANIDFNGHYLFSGTATTEESMGEHPPFELVEGDPTEDNPSGLSVVFYGNFNDRNINKDENSTETINVKADELFGENGTGVFEPIVQLYNLLKYDANGELREADDLLNTEMTDQLNEYQKKIAEQLLELQNVAGKNGATMNRLTAISEQLSSENLRLKDFRSIDEDTDYATTTMELKKDEIALEYALQIGSNIMQYTLFDFLG